VANEWILSVLADLKDFAAFNDLPVLAGALDDTMTIASVEILAGQIEAPSRARGHGEPAGISAGDSQQRRHA